MSTQPDNILLSFLNVDELSTDGGRSNDTHYYYREGQVYIDGQENIPEFKRLNLSNDQLSKTTMVVIPGGAGTYNTIDGFNINYSAGDMILVVHNYTGNTDLYDTSKFSSNSWWYDTNWHKMYRVYLRVGYTETESRSGENLYNWRVKEVRKVYRTHDEDDKSGVYTFTNIPTEDIGITASVRVDKYSTGNVWETVKLNLYYNDSLLGSETLDTTVTSLPTTMNLLIDRAKEDVNINDELKMSVEVEDAPSTHNDSLFITEYTMSISSATNIDAPETILGFSENLGLERDFDCQPTLNNTMVARQSEFIQDIDYSISSEGSGSVTPQNLSEILRNQATKATVPDSNYTQYSSVIPKYYGSKTNRTGINLSSSIASNNELVDDSNTTDLGLSPFYFTRDNLGAFPNVESKNTYLGYFEKIIDPYPLLNGKTAYYVKYLVDKNTDVQDPSLSIQGLNNLKNTFKTNDVNNLPTSVKASVQNIDEAKELKDLETLSTVYNVGEYPTTVLYSQTSSGHFSNKIILSGSTSEFLANFDLNTETYKNLAFRAEQTINNDINTPYELSRNLIDPTEGETTYIGTPHESQNYPVYQYGETQIKDELTDEYTFTVNYTFFTTHIPPYLNYNGSLSSWYGLDNFTMGQVFGNFQIDVTKTENGSTAGLPIRSSNVNLIVWSNPNLTPTSTYEGNSKVVNLYAGTKYYNLEEYMLSGQMGVSFNRSPLVEYVNNSSLRINFDSYQIYNAQAQSGQNIQPLQSFLVQDAGKAYELSPDRDTILNKISYEKGNYLEWNITLRYALPNPKSSEGYKITVSREGNITKDFVSFNRDWFFRNGDDSGVLLNRQFNPPDIDQSNLNQASLDLRGLKTPTEDELGVASRPFFKYYTSNKNQIYLANNLLNNNYGFNYYQIDLPYKPGNNTNFPFSIEPSFTRMPSATNSWEIKIGDEIRFENLESKSFKILNISDVSIEGNLRKMLTVDRDIPNGTELDFFVIRRFKPSNNFVILNQQKPYGVPPSASSAPGILQTEFQSEELETNPDKVIINLIERNLI